MDHDQQSLKIDQELAALYLEWTQTLRQSGHQQDVIAKFERAAAGEPGNALAQYDWGEALYALGRFEEAADRFRQATETDPMLSEGFRRWADSLSELGDTLRQLRSTAGPPK